MKIRMLLTGRMWNNEEGFSFLEIIIVLVIMSLMMAVVVPNFSRMFASVEGAREGGKVLHLFEKARAEAILRAESVGITFYPSGLCIFQFKGTIMEYEDLRMAVMVTDEEEKIVQTFRADGTAELPKLTFETNEGKYIIYTFNPVSGKIEMERSASL